jgi:hypothetical protein
VLDPITERPTNRWSQHNFRLVVEGSGKVKVEARESSGTPTPPLEAVTKEPLVKIEKTLRAQHLH